MDRSSGEFIASEQDTQILFEKPWLVGFYLRQWMTAQGMTNAEIVAELERVNEYLRRCPSLVATGIEEEIAMLQGGAR